MNPTGLCQCGCGLPAPVAKWDATRKRGNVRKGDTLLFRKNHGSGLHKDRNWHWKGGVVKSAGYLMEKASGHPRANPAGYVFQHILIVERALGRFIVKPEEIHHVNGDRADNRPQNLVVCPDHAYHALLHLRQRAVAAGCPPNWRKCSFCKRYDAVENMAFGKSSHAIYHRECDSHYRRERYRRKKEAA